MFSIMIVYSLAHIGTQGTVTLFAIEGKYGKTEKSKPKALT